MKFLDEWQDYKDNTIPQSASPHQITETKKAFYSGAIALVSITIKMFSEGSDVTDEDVNSYDSVVKEIISVCESFGQQRHSDMN